MKKLIKLVVQAVVVLALISSLMPVSVMQAAPHQGVTVRSIKLLDPNPTSLDVVRFLVTFSHPVIDVDLGDFGLTVTGEISGVQLFGISGSGKTRTVSVSTGTGNGTIRLDVIDNDTIESTGGVYFDYGFFGGPAYKVEKGPIVPVAALPGPNPTSGDQVVFVFTFPDEVGEIAASDFLPQTTGTIRNVEVISLEGSGNTYQVVVSTGIGDGTIMVSILEDNQITDLNGDPFENAAISSEAYLIERPFPVVLEVVCLTGETRNVSQVEYSVVFSRPVIDLDMEDFALETTGEISGVSIASLSGSGAEYTVSVNTGTGSGTIRLDVMDNDTIEDLDGNYFEEPFSSGEACSVEKIIIEAAIQPGSFQPETGTYSFEVVFSSPVPGLDLNDLVISGIPEAAAVSVTGEDTVYLVEITGLTGDEKVSIELGSDTLQTDDGSVVKASSSTEMITDLVPENTSAPMEEDPRESQGFLWWMMLIAVLVIAIIVFLVMRRKK